MTAPSAGPTVTSDLARILEERVGLVFPASREADLEAGARRAMARAGITDPGAYAARLGSESALLDDILAEVTIGETYFFREPDHFEFIRREVLPEALARRGDGQPVRMWSAACASGEEAYSLAVLLDEGGLSDRGNILATDVSRQSLARARRGAYSSWSLRGVDPRRVDCYFRRDGPSYLLEERVRRRVSFDYLNLALDAYPSLATGIWGLDLVLCRNVLIYFGRQAVQRVAARLHGTLADGGWLVTGPSDPPLGDAAPFDVVTTPWGIFYRRRGPRTTILVEAPCATEPLGAAEVPDPPLPTPLAGPPAPVRLAPVEPGEADRIRALANARGPLEAAVAAGFACAREPLSAELRFLRGVLLWAAGRDADATRELRRAIYVDPTLATAHFVLGSVLDRSGDAEGARRAFRNALSLAAARPPHEAAPLADGETFARLAGAARARLALLEDSSEGRR